MRLGVHENQRSVRISDSHIKKLTAEAETTGAGKPSVLLRMFVTELINSTEGKIEEVCAIGRLVGNHGSTQRLTIRFSAKGDDALQTMLDRFASGEFSVLATGILASRYDDAKLPVPAGGGRKPRTAKKG